MCVVVRTKCTDDDKGIDELLRDCGYFDRVPIDIHEQRFKVRTGIFQQYSPSCDPLDKREYHEALVQRDLT
jgi:hypothetical protein